MAKRTKRRPQRIEPPSASTRRVVRAHNGLPAWLPIALKALLIIAAGVWIYWPALHGDWLWDDNYLIENNELVHDPYGIWDIWFRPSTLIDYFPMTVSVEWLLWQIWGSDTFTLPFHLTNLVLHLTSALLVWRLLAKFGLRLAWLGGLIFVVHPIMVESVAWMSELKNTLSMPPFLLAMCAWIDYREKGRIEHYCIALVLFLISMLCKTTMVMFPFIILLYAWWQQHGRIGWKDVRQSIPFFVVSFLIGLLLIHYEHFGIGGQPLPLGGFFSRMACGGLSLSFYFSKYFLPLDMLPMYPQWHVNPPSLIQFLPWPVVAGALYWLWTKRETWGRHALLGVGFFLGSLLPFVSFRPISFMRFSWVMDHFLYLPMIGLTGLTVAALGDLQSRLTGWPRTAGTAVIALILAILAIGSEDYASKYVDLETLWTYTIERDPSSWVGHNDLAYAMAKSGRLVEAAQEFEIAIQLYPNYAEAHNNLGVIYQKLGREAEAIAQFQEAIRLDPDQTNPKQNLAAALAHVRTISTSK